MTTAIVPVLVPVLASLVCSPYKKTFSYSQARQKIFNMEDTATSIYDRGQIFQHPFDYSEINIEHVYPQSWLHEHLEGYKFNEAKADMHHLFLADVSSNSRRGNRTFQEGCTTVGEEGQVCKGGYEPPEEVKGIVARATLYVSHQYNIPIPSEQEEVIDNWDSRYPVTAWEANRDEYIYRLQGNHNPFVHCR